MWGLFLIYIFATFWVGTAPEEIVWESRLTDENKEQKERRQEKLDGTFGISTQPTLEKLEYKVNSSPLTIFLQKFHLIRLLACDFPHMHMQIVKNEHVAWWKTKTSSNFMEQEKIHLKKIASLRKKKKKSKQNFVYTL